MMLGIERGARSQDSEGPRTSVHPLWASLTPTPWRYGSGMVKYLALAGSQVSVTISATFRLVQVLEDYTCHCPRGQGLTCMCIYMYIYTHI